MKILIISDTHGNNKNVINVISNLKNKINLIIHLGDCDTDAQQIIQMYPTIPVEFIAGNCDFGSNSIREKILNINNNKILITHGHMYNVKWNYDRISYVGEEKKVQAVLFGHTHSPYMKYMGRVLVMNPGSISLPRDDLIPTYGIINITDNGVLTSSVVGIYKDGYKVIL